MESCHRAGPLSHEARPVTISVLHTPGFLLLSPGKILGEGHPPPPPACGFFLGSEKQGEGIVSTPRPEHKGKLFTEPLPTVPSARTSEKLRPTKAEGMPESGSSAESPEGSGTHGACAGAVWALCQVRGQTQLSPIVYSKELVRDERPQAGLCPSYPTGDKKDGA